MELPVVLESLGLIGLLAAVGSVVLLASLLTLFLACKSRSTTKDDLNPLKGIGAARYPDNTNESTTNYGSSCKNATFNQSPTKMIKVSSCYASLASESSSDEEENFGYSGQPKSKLSSQELRVGPKGYIKTMTVQPSPLRQMDYKNKSNGYHSIGKMRSGEPVNNLRQLSGQKEEFSDSSTSEKGSLLMLTISSLKMSKENGSIDNALNQHRISISEDDTEVSKLDKERPSEETREEKCLKLQLISCENLKRSTEKENAFSRVVRRATKGYGFAAEGVFARVYPLNDVMEPCKSRQSSGDENASFGNCNSEFYLETSFVSSRKSKNIKFSETDGVLLSYQDFPLRISIYEMDKNKIRSALGHAVVNCKKVVSTIGQTSMTLRLYSTVFEAIQNCCGDVINPDASSLRSKASK